MKGRCEAIVKESGLRWTIFRPSSLVTPDDLASPEQAGTHGVRRAPPGQGLVFGAMRHIPGLAGFADDVRPIPIDVLCDAMIRVARATTTEHDGAILEGRHLWALAGRA
jgi:uncharacterized protein YbjT (DUF2867 family)